MGEEQETLGLAGVELRVPKRFEWPPWFTAGKNTPRTLVNRVANGRHPMGGKLGPVDSRCGTCAHLTSTRYSTRYFKCELCRPWTSTLMTDIRLKWRGCHLWKEKP